MDDRNIKGNFKKYIYILIFFFFIFLIPTYKTHWIKHTLFFVMNFKEKESRNYFPCFWPLNKNNDSMEKRWWNSLCMASSMKRIFYLDDDGIPFSAEPSSLLWISGVIIIIACWKPRSQCFARWVRLGPICVRTQHGSALIPPSLIYPKRKILNIVLKILITIKIDIIIILSFIYYENYFFHFMCQKKEN